MAATAPTSSSSVTSDNIAVMKLPSQELEQDKDFQRIYAVTVKLPKQLRIQDRRICRQFRKVVNHQKVDIDVLVLDVETYYTVAHDLLKLMLGHHRSGQASRLSVQAVDFATEYNFGDPQGLLRTALGELIAPFRRCYLNFASK